jgi:hypothetical protein
VLIKWLRSTGGWMNFAQDLINIFCDNWYVNYMFVCVLWNVSFFFFMKKFIFCISSCVFPVNARGIFDKLPLQWFSIKRFCFSCNIFHLTICLLKILKNVYVYTVLII